MTEIDTSPDRIAAIMDGVTDAPWRFEPDEGACLPRVESVEKLVCTVGNAESWLDALDEWTANARFIAAARDLVPALAAERDALRAEVDRLRDALEIASRRADQWADDDDLSDWAQPARIIAKDIAAAMKGGTNER